MYLVRDSEDGTPFRTYVGDEDADEASPRQASHLYGGTLVDAAAALLHLVEAVRPGA